MDAVLCHLPSLDVDQRRPAITYYIKNTLRTPERNGKVERSRRIDREKSYRNLRFFSLQDLAAQGARWAKRYNDTPRMVLKMKSPNEAELGKLAKLKDDTGEVRCRKLLKRFTSIAN